LPQESATPSAIDEQDPAKLSRQVTELSALVQKLQARLNDLEEKLKAVERSPTTASSSQDENAQQEPTLAKSFTDQATSPQNPVERDANILRGTTVNFLLDGYYGYSFNNPIGRANLLRAYDVSSNAFSLNQADLVIENAPHPAHAKRFGLRFDLQYGQATRLSRATHPMSLARKFAATFSRPMGLILFLWVAD
jgi:uncharacterized coiled-coil protein SlyX